MKKPIETISINQKIKKATSLAIEAAIQYEDITGRKLGITGEVGEVLACDNQELRLMANPLSVGFDAIDDRGKRYQIKTRRVAGNKGRIGSFSKHKFDYAILAILGANYEISELYIATYKKLKPLIDKHERRNPSIREFKKIADELK